MDSARPRASTRRPRPRSSGRPRPRGSVVPRPAASCGFEEGALTERDGGELQRIVAEALTIGDVVSAAIFVVGSDGGALELAAAAGITGPPLEALVNAVRNPAHPVARALDEEAPSFDVHPIAPGGPALRSHLSLTTGPGATRATIGVLAVAHDAPAGVAQRQALRALADRAVAAIAS